MHLFPQPLLDENDGKEGGHNKVQPLHGELDQGPKGTAQRDAGNPVQVIQDGYPPIEPAPVDAERDFHRIVDGESLITQELEEKRLFQPMPRYFSNREIP